MPKLILIMGLPGYSRASSGMVRDCHGDLHTGNIFLGEVPHIFDCIEFRPLLRHMDILDELAFLYMDLESRGAKQLATRFLNQYRSEFPKAFLGQSIDAIWLYYKLYRANVRTKVCLIRQQQLAKDNHNNVSMYLQQMYKYALEIERDFI